MNNRSLIVASAFAIIVLTVFPLLGLVLGIFNSPSSTWQQLGLVELILNTFFLGCIVSFFSIVIGTWLAWAEHRTDYWGRKWLGIFDLLPLAMPSYLLAVVLRESMDIGFIFKGFIPAVLVLTIITIPYVKLLVYSALTRLSVAEEEAASCLGASKQRVFWQIVLPYLRPSVALAGLVTFLYVISDFGAVAVLDVRVLTWRLYQTVETQQLVSAALLGGVLLIFSLILFFVARWVQGFLPKVVKVSNPRSPVPIPLKFWSKIITYSLHTIIIGIGFVIPVWVLSTWIYQGLTHQLVFAELWSPIYDTMKLTLLSSIGIVILAFFPAWVVARKLTSKTNINLLEQGVFMTSSLPGILLAFGLMLTALYSVQLFTHSRAIYYFLLSSGILLFLGYMMRFLAEAYAGLKNTMLLFDPRLSDSARLLNTSKIRYVNKILLPSLAPGIRVALLLSLLAIVKELPITLLLGNAMGIRTLSMRIFDRYQEAFLYDVGSAGLVLLSCSLILVIATLRWRKHV